MKKMLGLLTAMTITSNIGSLITASNSYDKINNDNKLLNYSIQKNRQKRDSNDKQSEIEVSLNYFTYVKTLYASFRPIFWRQIIVYRVMADSQETFVALFRELVLGENSPVEIALGAKNAFCITKLARIIWYYWNQIDQIWAKSDKKHRIKIVITINPNILVSENYNGSFDNSELAEYGSTTIRMEENAMD